MGRIKGSKNKLKQPKAVTLSDTEKIDFVADLLLELVIDEFASSQESQPCQAV
jgi:hypothetical protein